MLTLIVNPIAGNGHAAKVAQLLQDELNHQNVKYETCFTTSPGNATILARNAAIANPASTVVSVGGDGTLLEVARGLEEQDAFLGIIPAGTGNDFIKSLGLPTKPLEALRFILSSPARPLDTGRLNDELFLNVCGTGFDVQVLDETVRFKKHFRGLIPYLLGLIKAIVAFHPVHVKYKIDSDAEVERDVLLCSVANGRYIGGGIPICPTAKVDDGLLDMVIVEKVPRWKIPFYLPGLLGKKVLNYRVTKHVQCTDVIIESSGMRMQIDGEIVRIDQAHFQIQQHHLMVHW